jgi:hypothetical protein
MEFKGIEQFDYLEKGIFSFIPKQAYRIKKTELWWVVLQRPNKHPSTLFLSLEGCFCVGYYLPRRC